MITVLLQRCAQQEQLDEELCYADRHVVVVSVCACWLTEIGF